MDYLSLEKDMFYSIVNMKLRDVFEDIEDLCLSENINLEEFNKKLKDFDFKYDRTNNRLIELN